MRITSAAAVLIAIFIGALAEPAASAIKCNEASLVCKDKQLSDINKAIARRERILAGAAMHPALRGEISQSDEDWRASTEACTTAKDPRSCYRTRLRGRLGVMTLLDRVFAGPRLADDPARACQAQKHEIEKCSDEAFTAADTVYGILARAIATSLSTVDMQNPASPDGGSDAEKAEEAFRIWRSSECRMLEMSPLVEKHPGGAVTCEAALTWREIEDLAVLLGRAPHWSEQLDEIAAGIRACFDRGRDEDVELRVIDVFAGDAGRTIRLLGSRGRYDCVAAGDVAAEFSAVPAKAARPGEGEAVFIAVQGLRPPQDLLATMPGRRGDCYETNAVIQAGARLSGWIALSRCD